MRKCIYSLLTLTAASTSLWGADVPATAEDFGLVPLSPTFYVNPPVPESPVPLNNSKVESIGVAVASNGNVIIGWEDDGNGGTDYEAVWTLYDSSGTLLTPSANIVSNDPSIPAFDSTYRAFFRADGTPISGYTAWGPKIKANPFGPGMGMGAVAFSLGVEVPELAPVNETPGDFPAVQLFNNDGSPASPAISGLTVEDATPSGNVRIGDWDYLSNGNILIVSESRQGADLVERFGGAASGNHAAFRIVKADGTEVKSYTLASEEAVVTAMWHGAATLKDGFAIRFEKKGRGTIRIFNNDGSPRTGDIDLGLLAGDDRYAAGGRGDGNGFHGNGGDSIVSVTTAKDADLRTKPYVMVINADGSLRWAKAAAQDIPSSVGGGVDAAISEDGRVAVVFSDRTAVTPAPGLIVAQVFSRSGEPLTGSFLVSEKETPASSTAIAEDPRAAWRGGRLAVIWESRNEGSTTSKVVAGRVLSFPVSGAQAAGLAGKSATVYINPPVAESPVPLNNSKVESIGVAIASNGNVIVGWEDDGNAGTDYEAVWTLYSPNGTLLTPSANITSNDASIPAFDSTYRAFFRADGTPISGYTAWGPKIKANPYGPGIGMGAVAFSLGVEVPELAAINETPGDFPALQLFTDDGGPLSPAIAGLTVEDATPSGNVRIGDWDYLSDGNILVVSESRQGADLVNRFGGAAGGNHAAFRIVKPDGSEVKAYTLASEEAIVTEMWHGAATIKDGFAIRFAKKGRGTIRIFNNDGSPRTGDIDLGILGGDNGYAQGGRGDGAGFHGNGVDAFVAVANGKNADGLNKAYVMVINADGSLRWAGVAGNDIPASALGGVDAAIAADGRVAVAFSDRTSVAPAPGLVLAQLFSANGSVITPSFLVSESETPSAALGTSEDPRIAWRGDKLAVIWESRNAPGTGVKVVTLRVLSTPSEGSTTIEFSKSASTLTLTWNGGGTLESASSITGPWEAVAGATSPASITIEGAGKFFRVR